MSGWRRAGLGAALALALATVSACGASPEPHPRRTSLDGCSAATAVRQATVDATSQLRFVPRRVCLRAGGTVTWVNTTSGLDHTSTDEKSLAADPSDAVLPAGAKGWNLRLPVGHSARLTLRVPGVYHYFCIPHETLGMLGVIVVVRGS